MPPLGGPSVTMCSRPAVMVRSARKATPAGRERIDSPSPGQIRIWRKPTKDTLGRLVGTLHMRILAHGHRLPVVGGLRNQ